MMKSDAFVGFLHALKSTKLLDVPYKLKNGVLVSVTSDTSVRNAIDKLTSAGITSAPIFSKDNGGFIGFVDFQQLVRFVARLETGDAEFKSFAAYQKKWNMVSTTLDDLVSGRCSGDRRILGEYCEPLYETDSLYDAMTRSAMTGCHHIAVQNAEKEITSVFSLSTLVEWIDDNIDLIPENVRKLNMENIRTHKCVISINEHRPAIDAFSLMDRCNTSRNGLAVTGPNDQLVDVISTHDLREIAPGTVRWNELYLPIRKFKDALRDRFDVPSHPIPINLKPRSTFDELIRKMAGNVVHRIFIVDEHRKAVDCISQFDIVSFLVLRHGLSPIFSLQDH